MLTLTDKTELWNRFYWYWNSHRIFMDDPMKSLLCSSANVLDVGGVSGKE